MDFNTDIFSLDKPSSVSFNFCGVKLPNNNDVYFRAKQHELVEQYSAARIFMRETDTEDWNHWFHAFEDEDSNAYARLILKSHFYETALFYYNAVVDISWALCYVASEFACSQKGGRVSINEMKSIEEAAELLRSSERNVTTPTAEDNPFSYLKTICPEFAPAIDQIIEFWTEFSSSDIRKRYNFCKHKGRPKYTEIEKYNLGRMMNIYFKHTDDGEFMQIPSDIRDVQYSFSLEEAIQTLKDFDDNTLFPYINKLVHTLENILKPSPMIF